MRFIFSWTVHPKNGKCHQLFAIIKFQTHKILGNLWNEDIFNDTWSLCMMSRFNLDAHTWYPLIFLNNTLFNLALWFKLYFSFRESYDLILIWSIDINQNVQLIPYLTIVQRVVRFQYIWEILFILVATI